MMLDDDNDNLLPRQPKCPDCGMEYDPDTCQCGAPMRDHKDGSHVATPLGCLCGVSVEDMLNVVEKDLTRLSVSSHIWVAHIRDAMWLLLQVHRRQQRELEELRARVVAATKEPSQAVVVVAEEAYNPDNVRMCFQCMTRHRPSEGCEPWPEKKTTKGPFANTSPPPRDKETTVFPPKPETVYPEEETQAALNVPCMFCGEFPKAQKDGTVYCDDTCWGDVCPRFPPQKWIDDNGDAGWRVRELRSRKQGDDT